MRVVIDASIDPRLVEALPDHHVQTLFDLGWQHLKDHVLVKISFYRPLYPQLLKAVTTIRTGCVMHVYSPPAD